jgi:predicted PurR-regulated permease PerM
MPQTNGGRKPLIALLLLAGLAVWFIYVLMKPFLEPIFFAVVLAIAATPLHRWLSRRVRSTGLAALATTAVLMIAVLLPLWALGVTIAREARDTYAELARHSAQGGGWSAWLGQFFDPPIRWLADKTGMPAPSVHQLVVDKAQSYSTAFITWGGSLVGNITATLGNAILSFLIMIVLFAKGAAIREGVMAWMPLPRARTTELLTTISDSIIANVYGIAAVGAVQGFLVGIGFWIAGLPAPVMWGAISGLCSLVPIVGPALVWGPGVLILLLQGAWGKALFLTLWGVLAVGMADNVLRPWILSGRTELNTLVVFFALMGGVHAFGFIGLFAGPVIFSVAISVFRILREEYLVEPETQAGA